MKKLIVIAALAAVTGMRTGCLTRATAYTKTTNKDGSVTESRVSIVGTGDKASEVAAEGLFADGTADDLGAGVKNAKAAQQSTGIDGSLNAMGLLCGNIAQLMAASQGVKLPASASASAPVVSAAPEETGETATATAQAVTASAPRSVICAEGGPTVAILGNRATCSRCRKLWSGLDANTLAESLCSASIIDADKTDNPSEYAARRPAEAFEYPLVRVYKPDGQLAGQFSGVGMTQDAIVAKVKTLIPTCGPVVK